MAEGNRPMPNPRRGEVALDLAGRRFTLRLTLGALAELEEAFAVDGLAALGERLAGGSVRSRDLVALLGVAIRGGGVAIDDHAVADLADAADLPTITDALARLLHLNFGEGPARPPTARVA